ncbi:MAG: 2-amino-4-hydroxy-6-hydroxymethyldihydropteridine diphosphokinase, partial [Gemmatimonadota bacterium]
MTAGLELLGAVIEIDGLSWVYRTEPLGNAAQPDFWNLAATGVTGSTPEALLEAIHRIEDQLGRER